MSNQLLIFALLLILALFFTFLYIFAIKKPYREVLIKNRLRELEGIKTLYSDVLMALNDGIAIIDEGKNILFLNQSFSKNIRSIPSVEKIKNFDVLTRNFELNNIVKDFISRGESKIEKSISYFDRAEEKTVYCVIQKINNSGKYAVIVRDITYIQKIENVRSDFIQNISHEIKTPITAVMGFVETLKNGAITNPETAVKFLNIIEHHTKRLNYLIDDLIFLTRIETGRSPVKLETISLKPMVEQSLLLFEKEISEKRINVTKTLDDKKFISDQTKISQIIINLIQNAVKYSNKNGDIKIDGSIINNEEALNFIKKTEETSVIWGELDRPGKYGDFFFFRVEDSGIGVSYTNLLRLGERFFRVDSSHTGNYKGTGLGLAIIKHTLKFLDGIAMIKSVQGKNFIFTFLIPL